MNIFRHVFVALALGVFLLDLPMRPLAFAIWIKRVTDIYPKCVWLNPEPEEIWSYRQSIGIIKELMNGRMYLTTLNGLERAMKLLTK